MITSPIISNMSTPQLMQIDDKSTAFHQKIMKSAVDMMRNAQELLLETRQLSISTGKNCKILEENCQKMFDTAFKAWSLSRQFCSQTPGKVQSRELELKASEELGSQKKPTSPFQASQSTPSFTAPLKLQVTQPANITPIVEIDEEQLKKFLTKGRVVDTGESDFVKAGTEHILTGNVKCCIAVLARSYNQNDGLEKIGIAHVAGEKPNFVKGFLKDMQGKSITKIGISLVGGYADTASNKSLYGCICKEIQSCQIAVIQQTLLNPYKVVGDYSEYERELDLIGFQIDLAITKEGRIFIHYNSISRNYSRNVLKVLRFFLEKQESNLRAYAKRLSENSAETREGVLLLLKKISQTFIWASKDCKRQFMASYPLFLGFMETLAVPQR